MTISFQEGEEKLTKLISELPTDIDFNEADTRHQIIDCLVHDCLGWQRSKIKVERRFDGNYSDYELDLPPKVVIEAKRSGISFQIPSETTLYNRVKSLPTLIKAGSAFKEAFVQASTYCAERGIQIGAISNGKQLIVFLGVRNDGIPPIDGKCIIFMDLDDIRKNFSLFWELLSPEGTKSGRLLQELSSQMPTGIPQKFSMDIVGYPSFRYPSDSQQSLRTLSDLLIEDAPSTPALRQKFYEDCYCESGALAKDSLLSKQILSARYAAMFSPSEKSPTINPMRVKGKADSGIPQESIAEALGKRPIVIIGDVGVGKTSFIRNLTYVKAEEEIKESIYLYIDLGVQANLGQDLKYYLIEEIEKQLIDKYSIDLYENSFVRGIYHGELQRFSKGIYACLRDSNPTEFMLKELEKLESLTADKISHLKAAIHHLTVGRRKQFILTIDNTDQRSFEDQQNAFLAAQEFSTSWNALVLITLRPKTYFTSKASGSISAYSQRILTISPPRIDLFLEKRLQFSIELAEGRIPIESLDGISVHLDSIALFLKALLYSLKRNKDITELLSNITGGNLREVLELVKGFIGSANVDSDKIIEIMRSNGEYMIPLHEFSKQALLGEYAHYDEKSSIAYNLFDVRYPDPKEHFLSSMIVAFLLSDTTSKSQEGFIETGNIISECQKFGFVHEQVEHALRRLANKKLIETTERVTFAEGLQGLIGEMPLAFRITTIGAYHIQKWIYTFAYLDAILIDTPIFDSNIRQEIRQNIGSFIIKDRYHRISLFVEYLSEIWSLIPNPPAYFNWTSLVELSRTSFETVERAIKKQ